MHDVLSYPGPRRWFLPMLIGVLVGLMFVVLPDLPGRALARDAGLKRYLRAEVTALTAVRNGFLQARLTERDVDLGQSPRPHEAAITGIRRALDQARIDGGSACEELEALRAATETYARTVTPVPALENGILPETSANAISSALGRLRAEDEALLREPLLGMRFAERELRADEDPTSARQLTYWADTFATRVNEMPIPEGTRAKLEALVAAYQHDALIVNDARLQARHDMAEPRAAAVREMETALANAAHALDIRQQNAGDLLAAERVRLWWLLGAVLTVMALVVTGGGFVFHRAAALGHTPART